MSLYTNQLKHQSALNLIVYISGFLLFWEWLRPLKSFTDTGNISVFVLYAAFCFFLSYLQMPWYITSPLKLAGLVFVLDGLFIHVSLFSMDWYRMFFYDAAYNIQVMMEQEWWSMTPLFRSFLFLLLLWLLSYLLHYWFVIAKRTLFFVVLTFVYVAVVDTFTPYAGKASIIRVFLISMILLGITHYQRLLTSEKTAVLENRRPLRWILPLIALIFSSSVIGYAAPKFSPQWPDPVPFIRSLADNSGEGEGQGAFGQAVKKVGYGENDERLGGSFIQDDTVVFQAMVDEPQYWRIETKDFYTGKGWVRTVEEKYVDSLEGQIEMNVFSDQVETEEKEAKVLFNPAQILPRLVYPYGTEQIQMIHPPGPFSYGKETGEILPDTEYTGERTMRYDIAFQEPNFTFKALRNVPAEDPEYIDELYTQLPEDLPSRVKQLAEEIVQDETTRYDQAKAIERYFQDPSFRYETEDIPVPDEDQDYVDQFLFETQKGYCDNFSTAMVVLLRSVDIPARWVKGFTAGEEVDAPVDLPSDTMEFYEVTNSNAHSWVEVYFPEIGWVPFEPTKGFTNMADFSTGLTLEELLEGSSDDEREEPEQELADAWNPVNPETEEESRANSFWNKFKWVLDGLWLIIIGILSLATIFIYRYRYHLLTSIKRKQLGKQADPHAFEHAYQHLLSVLAYKGLKKEPDQTLREFALDVDTSLGTSDMKRLTHMYEQMIYRDQLEDGQMKKMRELWENLINRVLS